MQQENSLTIFDILTVPEASVKWGITEDKIKRYAREGKFAETEARRAGKNWLITRYGMSRIFGEPQKLNDREE